MGAIGLLLSLFLCIILQVLHEFHASSVPERRKFSLSNFASSTPMSGNDDGCAAGAGDSSDSEKDDSVSGNVGAVGGAYLVVRLRL